MCYDFRQIEASIHVVVGREEPVAAGHAPVVYDGVLAGDALAPGRSLARIYLAAVLDRLSPAAAVQLLQRCHRALAVDGTLRIATEDLDVVLDRVTSRAIWDGSGLPADGFDWGASRFHLLNHAFRQRDWFYNETELRRLATMVGFRNGRRVAAADDPRFQIERLKANLVVMEFRRLPRQDGPRPSVDILIPLYRPDHFAHALESALEQTWDPLAIIICDDGPGDASRAIIDQFSHHRRFPSIQYFQERPPSGNTANNSIRLLDKSSGAYVKFLCDDDVLEPRCVEKMATCLRDHPEVTLVTSHRRLIDEQGKLLAEIEATRRLVAEDSRVSGAWLIDEMLRRQRNYIGEPSTTMFRRADIREIAPNFWTLGGINFMGNADVTIWISLLAQGDGIYLTESLSRFRMHPHQTSQDPTIHEFCRAAWHRAVNGTSYLGLYDAATPAPLDATPLTDSPWWTPESRAHVAAARRALSEGDGAAALVSCERALAADPYDTRLSTLRARCLAASGQAQAAIDVLVEAIRGNPATAGPYLRATEMAWASGNQDGAKAVFQGVQSKLALVRPISGVVERHAALHLDPHAWFELVPSLPPLTVIIRIVCRNAAPTRERPIRVVLSRDGEVVATGELTGLGASLDLEAPIPSRPTTTRLDLRWSGAVDVVPAPTDEPLAVRLAGIEVYLV
jgi:predicted SAM-dependent methyltransferase